MQTLLIDDILEPPTLAESRRRFRKGERVWWIDRLGNARLGRIAGAFITGVTCRRDGVPDRTKPHYVPYDRLHKITMEGI